MQEMRNLSVNKVNYHGFIGEGPRERILDRLTWFTYEFNFGKSYLLDGELWDGGWSLTWIIAGLLKPDTIIVKSEIGRILLDGIEYPPEMRKKDVWVVPRTQIKRFGLFQNMSVQEQIQYGLQNTDSPYLDSETEIIERFYLTPERYKRLFRQLSHERWRASCAVGLANGKKIFCFPYINYVRPGFIEEYYELWFKEIVDLLRDSGALILIPARAEGIAKRLCDEIVPMRPRY